MGFKVGTVLNVDNALKMMLVKSANDIAMAVAETVGGSQAKFVARMNAEAARLGMASTHYDNPNGLPDNGQLTTARDLAVLASAILADFPEYASYFEIPAIKAGKRVLRSQNKLLEHYRGTTGMKTGFICASGYNIVASARRNGRTLVAVVLGAPSASDRNELAARLLDRGFAANDAALKPTSRDFSIDAHVDSPRLICATWSATRAAAPTTKRTRRRRRRNRCSPRSGRASCPWPRCRSSPDGRIAPAASRRRRASRCLASVRDAPTAGIGGQRAGTGGFPLIDPAGPRPPGGGRSR